MRMSLIILIALAGCADTISYMNSHYAAEEVDDPIPSITPSNMGTVCFYSPKDFIMGVYLYENDERINVVLPGTYSCINLTPGLHSLEGRRKSDQTIHLDISQGEIYYVKYTVGHSFTGDIPIFELMPEPSAISMMASLKHVQMTDMCSKPKESFRSREC